MIEKASKTERQSASSLAEELERARYRERTLESALLRSLKDLAESEARIKALRSSHSWRVSRPLRLVAGVLRRIKRLAKSQPKAS